MTPGPQEQRFDAMRAWRLGLSIGGILLLGFGIFRLLTELDGPTLLNLAIWLAAAVVLHDLLIAPATLGVAALLRRLLPDRVRRWVQVWLIASALVSVIAVPLVVLQGSQPAVKALLIGPYAPGWALLVGLFALVALIGYAVDRRRSASSAAAGRGS